MDQKTLATKHLVVVLAGSEGKKEFKDVAIVAGTKPRDILAKLGLHGLSMTNPQGGLFDSNADLFPLVADGQKIYVAQAKADAGK